MRIVRYVTDGGYRVGVVEGEEVRDAGADPVAPRPGGARRRLGDVQLAAPIARPEKIVCLGLNYADHAAETGQELPSTPMLFAKWPNTLVGPGVVEVPAVTERLDWEAELGVVIGRRARDVTPAGALEHVLGYTCVNDLSARDLQFADGQWTRGKSLDGLCPVGPWVVTTDELGNPDDLAIRCEVNGETVQDSRTSQMVFDVAEVVAFVSRHVTLEPGDLIATGTPPGVGFARTPPRFLSSGDTVTVEIEGIGRLESVVRFRNQG